MRWAREHPEEMERISRLPASEQNEALREAMVPLELHGCEICGRPVSREGEWCPRCQREDS